LKNNKRVPASGKDANKPAPGWLDAFYLSFEDRFRGPRKEIKKRVEIYLPLIRKAGAGVKRAPVLDLGCGRGEWLELLKEKKLQANGVDINSVMLAQCRQRKLKVVLADAVAHLRTLPASSLGAVTGFHIIEHLEFDVLMDLFAETIRVLRPGGVAIFESPNCKNLVVGATNFNIDPTHRNPVFPETAQFMLSIRGFENVELKYLAPVEAERFTGKDRQSLVLNELLYGPQDFAVIGTKPRSS
jgi:SAM-dependent methyltransferase